MIFAPPVDVPWVLETEIQTIAKVPVVGKVFTATKSKSAVVFESQDGHLVQHQRLCEVVVEDDIKMSDTVIPQAFIDANPIQSFAIGTLQPDYALDMGTTWVGVEEGTDPLPKRKNDPGIVDFEGDGQPGATVELHVSVFGDVKLRVIQVGHLALTGAWTGEAFEGTIDVLRFDQRTISASHAFFKGNPPTEVVPGGTTFRLYPVDAPLCPIPK